VVLAGALQGGRARADQPDAANGRIRNSSVGEEGLELEPRMVEEGGLASPNSSAVGEVGPCALLPTAVARPRLEGEASDEGQFRFGNFFPC
jgi:hypothetical protein